MNEDQGTTKKKRIFRGDSKENSRSEIFTELGTRLRNS
jgi:hypothetical protein